MRQHWAFSFHLLLSGRKKSPLTYINLHMTHMLRIPIGLEFEITLVLPGPFTPLTALLTWTLPFHYTIIFTSSLICFPVIGEEANQFLLIGLPWKHSKFFNLMSVLERLYFIIGSLWAEVFVPCRRIKN